MTLVSKHTPGEESSPYYLKNKEKCEEYESFINEIGGKTEGYYNAFSFNVMGTIDSKSIWKLRLKKSTFTSSGNLLLSSKYQSLLEMAQWSCDDIRLGGSKFTIRRKHWSDSIRMLVNSNIMSLPGFNEYVVKHGETNNIAILNLCDILSNLFEKGLVFTIKYERPKIFIDLRTNQIHKKEIAELIKN